MGLKNTVRISYFLLPLLSICLSISCLTSTYSTQSTTNSTLGSVLDDAGHDLQADTKYYIFPAQSGSGGGGGLALAARDRTCPFYVMQENLKISKGLPLRFKTADKKHDSISLSTDTNIVFNAATICVQSTAWRLGGADPITGRRYVKSGGVVGRPGVETVSNWFKIEKNISGNGYKIVFCPSVCRFCKVVCGNVGVFDEDGKRWLGLSDEPLVVMFKKV